MITLSTYDLWIFPKLLEHVKSELEDNCSFYNPMYDKSKRRKIINWIDADYCDWWSIMNKHSVNLA